MEPFGEWEVVHPCIVAQPDQPRINGKPRGRPRLDSRRLDYSVVNCLADSKRRWGPLGGELGVGRILRLLVLAGRCPAEVMDSFGEASLADPERAPVQLADRPAQLQLKTR